MDIIHQTSKPLENKRITCKHSQIVLESTAKDKQQTLLQLQCFPAPLSSLRNKMIMPNDILINKAHNSAIEIIIQRQVKA